MRAPRRWTAALLVLAIGQGASLQAQQPLSSWEGYFDVRAFVFSEPEPTRRERLDEAEARLRLGIRYNRLIGEHWLFDGEIRAVGLHRRREPGRDRTSAYVEVKRLHLRTESLFDNPWLWLDVGRDRIQSPRAWLYDDDMDQLRLGYDSTLLDVEAGVATWLWDGRIGQGSEAISRDEQLEAIGSVYLFGSAEYQWYRDQFANVRVIREDYERDDPVGTGRVTDQDDLTARANLTFIALGLRGRREIDDHALEYALDVASASGEHRYLELDPRGLAAREVAQDLEGGIGWDARLIGRFRDNRYAVGVGHARGDGEAGAPAEAATFRQPQIASNKDAVLGVARYRYYGETLAPRLSNMAVTSLWAGTALTDSFWLEAAWHRYRQRKAQPVLFSDRGVFIPNGRSRDVGQALDVVAGGRLREDTELLVAAGAFFDGDAFDGVTTDRIGYRLTVELNVRW